MGMATAAATQSVPLDRDTLRRLGRVVRAFIAADVGNRALLLAGTLFGLLLTINALNVVNSYVGRDFMTAIEQRSQRGFVFYALLYGGVFAASTVAAVIYRYTEERLGLLWREWMTRQLTGRYLERHLYYHLDAAGGLANPDQRIADDVRTFSTMTLSLALVFLNGTLTVLAFSGVLWSISRTLFLTAVVYAALGSLVTWVIGRPLVRLQYDQSDREADFRAQLVHVRANAETIAVQGWEERLRAQLGRQVEALVGNFRHIIDVNRNLNFFTTGYNYFVQLIPALLVAPLFMRGAAEFGVIPQSAMAFATLIGAFSLIVTQFPQLTTFAAVLARLNALGEASETMPDRRPAAPAVLGDPVRFAFEGVTLTSRRGGRTLVRALSLEVPASGRVLIAVPDDRVARALLLAVAGLWQGGEGRIVRPPGDALLLMPEHPYLPPGTLRDVLGGATRDGASDERLWTVLQRLGIEAAVRRIGGLDAALDWGGALTFDEQRLLGFARLVVAAPRYAVVVDPAAGLGAATAATVLDILAEAGIAVVVLGPPAEAPQRVDGVLEIAPDGSWAWADERKAM